MTCIVGFAHDGNVWLGGDRAGVSGGTVLACAEPKVFRRGPFIMGYTSSFRMGQLLQYSLEVPPMAADDQVGRYMRTVFIDAVRNLFSAGGYREKKDEREKGGAFLVGFAGRLWQVDDDFQVTRFGDSYAAVGSGADYALGALAGFHALPGILFLTPHQVLLAALSAAAHHNAYVRGPFDVIALEPEAMVPAAPIASASAPASPPPSQSDATGADA